MRRVYRLFRLSLCAAAITLSVSYLARPGIVGAPPLSTLNSQPQILVVGTLESIEAANLAVEAIAAQHSDPGKKDFTVVGITPETPDALEQVLRSPAAKAIVALIVPDSFGAERLKSLLPKLEQFSHPPIVTPHVAASLKIGTEPESVKRCLFQAVFSNPIQGNILAAFARNELGARRAGIVVDMENDAAVAIAYRFQAQFEQEGGSVVVGAYSKPAVAPAFFKNSQLDVVLVPDPDPAIVKTIQQHAPNATLLGSNFWESLNEQNRTMLDGSFFASGAYTPVLPDSSGDSKFQESFLDRFSRNPRWTDAVAYDLTTLVAFAAQSNSTEVGTKAFCQTLYDTKPSRGVTGMVRLNDIGNPVSHVQILEIKNQKIVWRISSPIAAYTPQSTGFFWRVEAPAGS